jgi:hypothetical protein
MRETSHNTEMLAPDTQPQRTLRLAWTLLLLAFGIFCALLLTASYTAWSYHAQATGERTGTLIVRSPVGLVTFQREGRTIPERAQDGQTLAEGSQVYIAPSAGYGQAATIRLFDQSTLDMWADTTLLLRELRTSRWNSSHQTVVLEQRSGYVRYDLRNDQPYETTTFLVHIGEAYVELRPGGSYSIEIIDGERQLHLVNNSQRMPGRVDVAVRTGSAELHSQNHTQTILAGQRIEINPAGIPSRVQPALWELIEDGDFSAFSVEEYNNTTLSSPLETQADLIRSDTWQVYSGPADAETYGYFHVSPACQPPQKDTDCSLAERTNVAWFIRSGNPTKPFVTGVRQVLGSDNQGIDISEYRSLLFSVWVRVLYQSVELTGDEGAECPVMIRFLTKQNSPIDKEQERVVCFYTSTDPTGEPERYPGITYYHIQPYEWYQLQLDLRAEDWMPDVRYLRSVEIYANGHEYNSRVTSVSLIGSHYPPRTGQGGCTIFGAGGCHP